MLTDDENPVTKQEDTNDTSIDNVTVRVEKIEVVKKPEKETDVEDPKPRIVLTFRSEKSGARSTNMKIVSTEEKLEDISPRRSIRRRKSINYNFFKESDDENVSHADSDDDEHIESMTQKRSTRRRSKEFSDVIANAIARKEKSYNEGSSAPTQRLSRRIKPTAKILANEELRMGLESQNNARLGISTEKPAEEGVRTRRSAQAKNFEIVPEKRSTKRKIQEDNTFENKDTENSNKKLAHMGTLGLKIAKDEESSEAENRKTERSANEGGEDEEIDDDTEVISQLLQADEESASDEDFCPVTSKRRRSRRNCSPAPLRRSSRKANLGLYNYDVFQFDDTIDSDFEPKRKTTRTNTEEPPSEEDPEAKVASEAVREEEEESEPAAPSEASTVVATCLCEETSNVYAAPTELTEPVFCQAIEMVEGVRVGCSHRAARGAAGALLPLRRPGLRAPYFLACKLHAAQLAKHMCCPTCGLFCTQGIFYQCSKQHLFHLECGIGGEPRQRAGCPHCGVLSHRWQALNADYGRVRLDMHCTNKRVFLPEQREQCTPAFLGFSSINPAHVDPEPTFPEELLPLIPNMKEFIETVDNEDGDQCTAQNIYELMMAEDDLEQIVPKIVRCENINECIPETCGGTLAHAAAVRGRLPALCVLRARGADLDAADTGARTPLFRAVQALLDKEHSEETEFESNEAEPAVKKEEESVPKEEEEKKTETAEEKADGEVKDEADAHEDGNRASDEDLVNVIKYLIAAGCDINKAGPEGMSAVHVSCQLGGARVCSLLVGAGGALDARDHGGWTPLVRAAENKHAAIVRFLLEAGADASCCDNEGNQPVHWCTLAGDSRCLAMLLRAAPHSINAPNSHTDTPLHIAAREGHYSCVVVLLAHGARTDIENSSGELPVEVCSGPCHDAISMNMQMTLAVKDTMTRVRILSSDISNGREPYPVSVVNEVDEAVLPSFTYVSQHVTTEHAAIDDTVQTMQGCECSDGACGGECGCCVLSVRRWYRAGRLPPAFPHHDPPVLFECNHTCGCNPKRCTNRVVGRMEGAGSLNLPVEVFRTRGRGWGLRAARRVARGTLVALYRGELLSGERADARTDDQYMFALDLKPDLLEQCSDKTLLCVDAARYGSAARFMNHSCRPSAAPVRVFSSARDLRLPHVAFFALRDLHPGDELTFDYGDKFWSVKSKWMKCECESPDCRYPTLIEESET